MKTKINTLLATVFVISVMGCATTSPTSSTGDKVEAPRLATNFTRDLSSATISHFDKSDCKLNESKLVSMKWREKVQIANACVAGAQWARVETLGASLAETETQSPWGAYFLGLAAESRAEVERASWMNEQALKRAPLVGMFHFQKARLAWKRQDYSLALESLLKSVQLDPNLIDAHLFLGQIFFQDQDFGRAARHFQAVIRARPKDPIAIMGLAECQIQLSDAKGAIETFRRGQSYHPSEALFLLREAYVHESLLNDIPKAIEVLKVAQKGYQAGTYTRELDFNLGQKISDLEISVRGNRSLAGSKSVEIVK